jgi:signal transduction histidine kinase/ActR/RegA family two-component response regulator
MLQAARNTVRRKVLAMMLATTVLALGVAVTALLLYELRTYRQSWLDDLTTQADIIGRSSAPALAFDDPESAYANLGLLRTRSGIVAAGLYGADGKLFASYRQNEAEALPASAHLPGSEIHGTEVTLYHAIVENGEVLGTLYLHGRYELWARLRDYLAILAGVTAGSLLVAFLVSVWLQERLTRPILDVARVARRVVEQRDFSLRAHRSTDDEIGVLVDAFNAMLDEVERRAEALRVADQRKDEFLATLAHELRNPLAPMSNAVAILRAAPQGAQTARAATEMMDRQLRQMVRLVDDLLDVSRITTGKLVLHSQHTDLRDAIRAAAETARPTIEARTHTLVVQMPDTPIFVHGDPVRLAQVFGNLLNNAAKYTDPGGRVVLAARRTGHTVEISVRDTGIGIPAHVLPSIFDMFAQGDTSLERRQSGLGVGLTLAKRLIEMHGGTIAALSEGPGHGSEFVVRLTAAVQHAVPDTQAPSVQPAEATSAARILLVDDNVDFASSLAALLSAAGHEVRVAHDAPVALEIAEAFRPQFGFFDIGMPGMSGLELVRRVRQRAWGAAAVLVAVTGWGQQKDRQLARDAGFDHHLVKPVEFAAIVSVLSGAPRPEAGVGYPGAAGREQE